MSPDTGKALHQTPLALNHRYIEAFRAVMIRGTATEAAAMLHTTQPVISKLIARFQQVSGIRLFELRKSRLVPTPEAHILFSTIERSYIGLEQIGQTLAELRGLHSGRVQIGCLPSMGMGLLPQIVRTFLDDHPSIQVAIETVDSNLVRNSVASGRLDIGITMRQVDTAGTHVEPLVRARAVCVMSADHRLATRKSISAKDLDGLAYIAVSRNDSMRAVLDQAFTKQKSTPIVVAETTYAITTCMLALQGVGVGIVSPLVVPPLHKAGLVAIPFLPEVPIELVLLTPLDHPLSQVAQAFVARLKLACEQFSQCGLPEHRLVS
ncbi:LysR substrate-binding domain-containing protein [Bordetella sp. BOR01]|uniref:LysR substrate-binding domain-containing protein n=1 Tax=Bordetella sp. BOR01 TaxID=2854779 RepID=UPI001C436D8B|nr:LysR substrate-binding domain-containing protein [Bordetella sp. BOR01]MBV7486473.1 LysR family transcriptional regulator [Bordetella sp. BOR01]